MRNAISESRRVWAGYGQAFRPTFPPGTTAASGSYRFKLCQRFRSQHVDHGPDVESVIEDRHAVRTLVVRLPVGKEPIGSAVLVDGSRPVLPRYNAARPHAV